MQRPALPPASAVVALAVALASVPAPAATILQRSVDLAIAGPAVVETVILDVRIEEPGDLDAWSEYSIGLDEHIRLESLEAKVLDAAGEVVERVPRRRCREITSTGFGLFSSQSTLVVPFPTLDIGQRVELKIVRRIEPVFPTWRVYLDSYHAQERLEIRVRGGGGDLRWDLQAADEVVEVVAEGGEIVLTGRDVPRRNAPSYAGDDDYVRPSLRLAWSGHDGWEDVAAWYSRLVAEVPRGDAKINALARDLTAALATPRQKLEALTEQVQRTIRYEAVEVGIGGWVPTPAHETLERGWGDCKDMSELLVELLRAADIPARLTLIRSGFGGAIDPRFPSTLGINHCVVAVPVASVETTPTDAVADGYLIIDPTVTRGGATWLNPYVQGQWALVAGDDGGELVQVPARADAEGRGLVVAGAVDADGAFSGGAALRLFGVRALGWLRDMDSEPPERIEETVARWLAEIIPAARIDAVTWKELEGEIPGVELKAVVVVPALVQGAEGRRRLRLGALSSLPEARVLDGRLEPIVLWPGRHRTVWRLRLPEDWCPPRPEAIEEGNGAGSVSRRVAVENGEVVIDREVVVRRPRYGADEFDELRALAVAASHGERRSVRLSCEG